PARRTIMKTVYLSLLAALIALPSHAATVVLNQAALAGLPDETVGWGFTITADPNQWILITHADFVPDPGFNPVGVFTAFITQPPNSNIVVGANSGNGEVNPWTQAFDNALLTGIGSYHINDFQSLGDRVEGAIVLSYDAYSRSPNDPAFDPTSDILALGQST